MANLEAHARTAATLAVLALVFLGGVAWAWSAVTEPFPDLPEVAPCVDTPVAAGDVIKPDQVLVSVMNAGALDGLARETMDDLVRHGFAQGDRANAPTEDDLAPVEVWTSDPESPAALLVASYLGDDAEILDKPSSEPGITVVVSDDFPGVVKGDKEIEAATDTSICSPPSQVDVE